MEARIVFLWRPQGQRLAHRLFYYTRKWAKERLQITGTEERASDTEISGTGASEDDDPVVHPVLDPSDRGRLDGLVEAFVIGRPRALLVRPRGEGMEPPFKRMRDRHFAVVEMRTRNTRTFGFFARPGVFVAHRVDTANNTHGDDGTLYLEYADSVLNVMARVDASEKDEISDIETLIGDGNADEST